MGNRYITRHDGVVIAIDPDDLFAPIATLYRPDDGVCVERFTLSGDALSVFLSNNGTVVVMLDQMPGLAAAMRPA